MGNNKSGPHVATEFWKNGHWRNYPTISQLIIDKLSPVAVVLRVKYITQYHSTIHIPHGGNYPILCRDLMYLQISLVSMRSIQLAVEATKCFEAAGASCVCCGKCWNETIANVLHDTLTHLGFV